MTNEPKYTLLPHPNEQGEFIAVSDEEHPSAPSFNVLPYITKQDNNWYLKYSGFAGNKIVYSTKFIHPSIPLIKKEQIKFIDDNLQKMADDFALNRSIEIDDCTDKDNHGFGCQCPAFEEGFIGGYNKRAETHPYTEEDLRSSLEKICKRYQ